MDASGRQRWLRTVILLGAVYLVIGIAFGTFAGWSASNQMVVTWRLLSFFTSAVVFAVHIGRPSVLRSRLTFMGWSPQTTNARSYLRSWPSRR